MATFKMFPDDETGLNLWLNSGSAAAATAEFVDNDNDDDEYIYETPKKYHNTMESIFTGVDVFLD